MRSRSADRPQRTPPAGFALAGGMLFVAALVALALGFDDVVRGTGHIAGSKKRPGKALTISGPPEAPFLLHYPSGWRKIPKNQLTGMRSTPAAAIRRTDGRGTVTLSVRGPLRSPLDELRVGFTNALAERFSDFELVTSTELEVQAGTGMYTSWILRDTGRVQGNLTIQVGMQSYTLDAALPTGATDVARDVGAIFGSFDVRK